MTIVLPHGVLFRGGEEETIRKTLIETKSYRCNYRFACEYFLWNWYTYNYYGFEKNKSRFRCLDY